ncbi:NADH-quinone oxidoreductase subunit E/NADP-reducing hydrogenase subunit HndA [Acetoanaerobium pronyense]|uniref:NADH-quinone oxidoreductase subunit E/NADP-reducing hydrogenase subunit HndA n=1 Tax=Acetoanaerobium pronyense TaxID=1482736 RepID=A0ABS4KF01_9FIRM|nr:NAD(P)H-dependent oxidoreductase subunit E [Acetoanaerobium pronyense]MBP2026352.1 NADH-quinone oxidoreductase subunit E/NADP-reducing hydrogenase subunit HndA [Acetoanaerobium pronyense]
MSTNIKSLEITKENQEKLDKVRGLSIDSKNQEGFLIPLLHEIQSLFGYLPQESLQIVCEETKISMSEIYSVATFYSHFNLEPRGEYIIRVCLGTACYVKGSQDILDKLCSELKTEVGKTTADGKFSIEAARCLGACGLAPILTIGEKVYGRLVSDDVLRILKNYEEYNE